MKRSLSDWKDVYFSETAILDGRQKAIEVQARMDAVAATGKITLDRVKNYVSVYKLEDGSFVPGTALQNDANQEYHDAVLTGKSGKLVGPILHQEIMALEDVSLEKIKALCQEIGPGMAEEATSEGGTRVKGQNQIDDYKMCDPIERRRRDLRRMF
jgi:cobalamin biosynthesis protein CbiD